MNKIINKLSFWFNCARGYSIPITIMSWCVPFIFALSEGGNILYGLLALVGILLTHLGVNLFDDFVDYKLENNLIKKGVRSEYNFQKGKCAFILDGSTTPTKVLLVSFTLFAIASLIGIFFTLKCGIFVLLIMFCAALLGILYPVLTHICLGEIIVAIIYAPLLYTGTYYVMTKSFSPEIIIISISTGLLVVGLLHTHTFMDYDFDIKNNKKTLCSIAGSKKNAIKIQVVLMILAFINIMVFVFLGYLPAIMLLVLLSIPTCYELYRLLNMHIQNPEKITNRTFWMGPMENWKNIEKKNLESFMIKFLLARNVMLVFTVFLCAAKIISELTN